MASRLDFLLTSGVPSDRSSSLGWKKDAPYAEAPSALRLYPLCWLLRVLFFLFQPIAAQQVGQAL
jgi:hypothetical protein